ncbi:response regulator [Paenibacillus sp. GCM10027628]|uniref:response regulator transcription factor n=1 Tax=Paenibacillus sp. GCM10027628 TaxID=3273413 RepID=UPI0036336367
MKLLIADDDEQIRSGIEQGIDWSALDIKMVVTASNGLEALQRFTELQPEIVITDVRMPGMDGLELLEKIKEINPRTRVIILSGYNDFEYLKKAIQLDAVDYEMKPIRARSLIALIQKVKDDIIRERVSEQEFQKYLESFKSNFGEELLNGSITDRLIILEGLQQYYGFDGTKSLICVTAQFDGDWKKHSDQSKIAADTICNLFASSDLATRGICLRSKEVKMVFLVTIDTNSYLYYRQYASELVNRLRSWNRETRSQCRMSFSAGISSPGNISEFVKLYQEANQALSMRLYIGSGSIQVYNKSAELSDKTIVGLLENAEFMLKLSRGDITSAVTMVENEFERMKKEREYSRKSVAAYSRNLLHFLTVANRNVPADRIEQIQSKIEFIEVNADFLTIEDFREIVVSVFEETGKHFSKDLSPLMIRADEFIRKNFTRELTVEMLSEYVGKTPNYFSHLFKREFGISFKEYVTRLRIVKAKELILNTNDLIYEISGKVGFSDYTYFTQVFKKVEGYPPAVLRKNNSGIAFELGEN